MQAIAKSKIMSVKDFGTNPHNIFTAHEYISMVDGALAVKFTV